MTRALDPGIAVATAELPEGGRPVLMVIRGPVGSGKITLARGLEQRLGFVRVDYDAEMLRALVRYSPDRPPTGPVRELARQEGRLAAGQMIRSSLAGGRFVACDADLRVRRELSELVDYDRTGTLPGRMIVVRLEISHEEARRRKVNPDWDEYRRDPRGAVRGFEFLWNFRRDGIEGEQTLRVDDKAPGQVLEWAHGLISAVT